MVINVFINTDYCYTRYSFLPADSCTDDYEDNTGGYQEIPREMYRDWKRSTQFHRLDQGRKESNVSLLKDFAKMSQMNLSR